MTATPKIELYGNEYCSYCAAARMLLKKKGLDWQEIPDNPEARREMQARGGGRTVPQVFIDGQPVGGFDELYDLEESGELDRMLGR